MFIPQVFCPENITSINNYTIVIGGTTSTETTSSFNDINHSRTLLQIVWSCISVLIACTWVSVHPNVPGPREGFWKVLGRKIGLMFMVLIAPELLILWAARQWFAAKKLSGSKAYRDHGWTTAHAFFALMGGFALYKGKECIAVLRFIPLHDLSNPHDDLSKQEEKKILGTLKDDETATKHNFPEHSFAAHIGFIGKMSEDQVKDRSHSDGFSKLIAVGQTTWFVVQLIARWAAKLPITELELMTFAFAVLNVLIYFFWWYKPQGVGCHIPIPVQSVAVISPEKGDSNEGSQKAATLQQWQGVTFKEVARKIFQPFFWMDHIVLDILIDEGKHHHGEYPEKISSFQRSPKLEPSYEDKIITSVAAVLFGAIHCIAWTFTFPSASEQLLWRISSLVVTCMPFYLVLLTVFLYLDKAKKFKLPDWAVPVLGYPSLVIIPLYLLARLDLIVQAFLALRDLPYGAFETVRWTTYIPHI